MFVFSGVFFSVDRFPDYVEPVTWILPMTHVIELVRPLTAGRGLALAPLLGHLGYLVALCVVAFVLAQRRLRVRMFD
jgi:lipooligosaccharide transport system permease protein